MSYYVYVLISKKDLGFYIGISKNPEKRLKRHNAGDTKSTKGRRPFELIYKEKYSTRKEAREREKYLKSGIGRDFIKNNFKNNFPR